MYLIKAKLNVPQDTYVIHIYINTHIHTYIHTYVHTYIHPNLITRFGTSA